MYITISRTINAVEYMIKNYDFDISKHNTDTEYKYSTAINEGSTSIDVSDFPIHTPNICKLYPSIDTPSNGNGRENGYVFGV